MSGGGGLTIEEATRIGKGVTEGMADDANVIFGSRLDDNMRDQIQVMSIIAGVKPKIMNASLRKEEIQIAAPSSIADSDIISDLLS